jgi:hypothetical protein
VSGDDPAALLTMTGAVHGCSCKRGLVEALLYLAFWCAVVVFLALCEVGG